MYMFVYALYMIYHVCLQLRTPIQLDYECSSQLEQLTSQNL